MVKKLLIASLVLLAIGAACLAGIWNWSERYFESSGPLEHETAVIVPQGASITRIAELLAEQDVILYPRAFTLILKFTKPKVTLQAGEYSFEPGISPKEAYEKLVSGETVVRQITIPEGLYTSQILDIINNTYGLTGDIPQGIREGDLLPESYHYHYGDTKASIIERMRNAMRDTIEDLWQKKADNLPFSNINQAITLASIVEKETHIDAERSHVASVFINRLRKNMRLQSDPTVIYAITNGAYVLDRLLTTKDLQVPSEYNTYVVFGLPPAPIDNPGKASIAAVLNPMETHDYYFVANGNGGHLFAKNLKEHNANVRKWRKLEKEKKQEQQEQAEQKAQEDAQNPQETKPTP